MFDGSLVLSASVGRLWQLVLAHDIVYAQGSGGVVICRDNIATIRVMIAVLSELGLRRAGPEAESGSNGVQCSMLNLNALKMKMTVP